MKGLKVHVAVTLEREKTYFALKDKSLCASFINGGKLKQFRLEPKPSSYYICKTTSGESAWCKTSISTLQITNNARKTLIKRKHLFAACQEVGFKADNQDLCQVV